MGKGFLEALRSESRKTMNTRAAMTGSGGILPLPEPWRNPAHNRAAAKTQLVPLDYLLAIPAGQIDGLGLSYSRRLVGRLIASVRREGFREPIELAYSHALRSIKRNQGHHRIEVARRLGLISVPVTFLRRDNLFLASSAALYRVVPGYKGADAPERLAPSEIGVPIIK